jgi:hypothetical protein
VVSFDSTQRLEDGAQAFYRVRHGRRYVPVIFSTAKLHLGITQLDDNVLEMWRDFIALNAEMAPKCKPITEKKEPLVERT